MPNDEELPACPSRASELWQRNASEAPRLVNRIGKVLRTGQAYELRDTDGMTINVAEVCPGTSPIRSAEGFRISGRVRL
jgi:hypothetical protein